MLAQCCLSHRTKVWLDYLFHHVAIVAWHIQCACRMRPSLHYGPFVSVGAPSSKSWRSSFSASLGRLPSRQVACQKSAASLVEVLSQGGSHATDALYKSAEYVEQSKNWSKFREAARWFKSAYGVNYHCQIFEGPWANNVAEVINLVCEELTFCSSASRSPRLLTLLLDRHDENVCVVLEKMAKSSKQTTANSHSPWVSPASQERWTTLRASFLQRK